MLYVQYRNKRDPPVHLNGLSEVHRTQREIYIP